MKPTDTAPDPAQLLDALAQWAVRDDTQPEPEVRRAANTAMTEIDRMLAALYAMRARLVGEIRVSDDAFAALVDARLAAAKAASKEADQ